MRYIIDRFEGDYVLLEDVNLHCFIRVSRDRIPTQAKEGTVLICRNHYYSIDRVETILRKKDILEQFERLKK